MANEGSQALDTKRGNQKLGKAGCCPGVKTRKDETLTTSAQTVRDDEVRVTPHLKGLIRAHMAARTLARRKGLRPPLKVK